MQADRCRNRTLTRGREFRPWRARCLSLTSKDAQPSPGEKPGTMADEGGLFLIVIRPTANDGAVGIASTQGLGCGHLARLASV